MIIGFGNGAFFQLIANDQDRFTSPYTNYYRLPGANAIEIYCPTKTFADLIIQHTNQFKDFKYVSIHAPDLKKMESHEIKEMLENFKILHQNLSFNNLVFHTDEVKSWGIFKNYTDLPISIENMDERKQSGKTVEDIAAILADYPFLNLTLDLQHCYANDSSLQLAHDFQTKFKEKIVQYHLSGYDNSGVNYPHYPLFKTKQDEIIKTLQDTNKPIIIESTFKKVGEQIDEFNYIIDKLK